MKHPRTANWFLPSQTLKHQIDAEVLTWLADEGSLTFRLKHYCPKQFSVLVLGEQWIKPDLSEAQLLGVSMNHKVLLRQVYLKCGENLCVYARSIIPLSTLQGKHRRLRFLGNKPLGEYLFASPSLKRSRIEWTKLTDASSLYQQAMNAHTASAKTIWGRRSLFKIDRKPLLVSEFFLPVLFK